MSQRSPAPLAAHRRALRCLAHPASLAAIVLLLANDHWLKQAHPSALTGKLSDLAGLLFFPFLLAFCLAWLPGLGRDEVRLGRLSIAITALWFAGLQLSPLVEAATMRLVGLITGRDGVNVRDATDLMALAMLWPAWWIWRAEGSIATARGESPAQNRQASHLQAQPLLQTLALLGTAMVTVATSVGAKPRIVDLYVDGDRVCTVGATREGPVLGHCSMDRGRTWVPSHGEAAPDSIELKAQAGAHACVEPQRRVCYRIAGTERIEVSDDAGLTWATSYDGPAPRQDYRDRIIRRLYPLPMFEVDKPNFAPGPFDLAIVGRGDQHVLVAAAGTEGVVVRDETGVWESVAVGEIEPTAIELDLRQDPGLLRTTLFPEIFAAAILAGIMISLQSALRWHELGLVRTDRDGSRTSSTPPTWLWVLAPAVALLIAMTAMWEFTFAVVAFGPLLLLEYSPIRFDSISQTLVWLFTASLLALAVAWAVRRWLGALREVVSPDQRPHTVRRWLLSSLPAGLLGFAAVYLPFAAWATGLIQRYRSAAILAALFGFSLLAFLILRLRGTRRGVEMLALVVAAFATLATSPPYEPQVQHIFEVGDRVCTNAVEFENAHDSVACSADGGRSWQPADDVEAPEYSILQPPVAMACVPPDDRVCYLAAGEERIEVTQDGGGTWNLAWSIPESRQGFRDRVLDPPLVFGLYFSSFDPGPYTMVAIGDESSHELIAANGTEGVIVRSKEGVWSLVPIGEAKPTPLAIEAIGDLHLLLYSLIPECLFFALLAGWISTLRLARDWPDVVSAESQSPVEKIPHAPAWIVFMPLFGGALILALSHWNALALLPLLLLSVLQESLGDLGLLAFVIGLLVLCSLLLRITRQLRLRYASPHRLAWLRSGSSAGILGFAVLYLPFASWALGWIDRYRDAALLALAVSMGFLAVGLLKRHVSNRSVETLALLLAAFVTLATTRPEPFGIHELGEHEGAVCTGIVAWPDGTYAPACSDDGGWSWDPSAELDFRPISTAPALRGQTCVEPEAQICYRAETIARVEQSLDGGASWSSAWELDPARKHFIWRQQVISSKNDYWREPPDMIILGDGSDHAVIVAAGTEGVVVRRPDGSWHRRAVATYQPSPLRASPTDLVRPLAALAVEFLLAVLMGLIAIALYLAFLRKHNRTLAREGEIDVAEVPTKTALVRLGTVLATGLLGAASLMLPMFAWSLGLLPRYWHAAALAAGLYIALLWRLRPNAPIPKRNASERPTFHMGHPPDVDLDKALSIAAEDEDAAVLDKMDPRRPR